MKVTLFASSTSEHWTLDVLFVDIELNGHFVNTVYGERNAEIEFVINRREARMERGYLVINSLHPW